MSKVINPKVTVDVEGLTSSLSIPFRPTTPPPPPAPDRVYQFLDNTFWEDSHNASWNNLFDVWRRTALFGSSETDRFVIVPITTGSSSGWQVGFRPKRLTLLSTVKTVDPGTFSITILSEGGGVILSVEIELGADENIALTETYDLEFPDDMDIASIEYEITGNTIHTNQMSMGLLEFEGGISPWSTTGGVTGDSITKSGGFGVLNSAGFETISEIAVVTPKLGGVTSSIWDMRYEATVGITSGTSDNDVTALLEITFESIEGEPPINALPYADPGIYTGDAEIGPSSADKFFRRVVIAASSSSERSIIYAESVEIYSDEAPGGAFNVRARLRGYPSEVFPDRSINVYFHSLSATIPT